MAGDRDATWHRSVGHQLVDRARRGEREAWAELYASFARTVHGIALAIAGPGHADDVTQEVFCSVFMALPTLRDAEALPGFVCTAARNAARDALRRRRRAGRSEAPDALPSREPSPVAASAEREVAERVLAVIRSLPEAYRETLVLRLVAGLTGEQIAEQTGLTHGSVRVNLTRGMALLRPKLAAEGLP
jgi:RNA polymerase sigma-70 factor, ECF subfamily